MERLPVYDDIISFQSLYKAHRRARQGKRHKKEVIEFELNLAENLWQLHYQLKYKTYRVGEYRRFMIYRPKTREIQAISYRDRVVQHSLCDNCLIPLLDRRLIYDNCACRKKKGTDKCLDRLSDFLRRHYEDCGMHGYFVKADVSKFFDNIDHCVLKEKLKKLPLDDDTFWLVSTVIDSYRHPSGKGIPKGNQSSQCFALYYLDCVDRSVKEKLRISYYVRYMDDIIAVVGEKATGNKCLTIVDDILGNNRLLPNPKSQIVKLKNGICFLGWKIYITENGRIARKITHSAKKRIISRLKERRFLSMEERTQVIASYKGHLSRGDAHNFYCKVANLIKREAGI